jgi:hypothetical protein
MSERLKGFLIDPAHLLELVRSLPNHAVTLDWHEARAMPVS